MKKYEVVNPATGETLEEFPFTTDTQIEDALTAADRAYRTWSRETTVADRAAVAQRAANLHRDRVDALAENIHLEMGKPLDQARAEVESSAQKIEAYVKNAGDWLADEILSVDDGLRTVVRKRGMGVILGIMPWNFPSSQVARFAAANLILGNTVVVKLPEQCPRTAAALEQLYSDAGFPPGAYVSVFATHDQIAEIIADHRIQGVSLTGSERAGEVIAAQAGRYLKKCVLELGGSDALIVLDTEDVDNAVAQAVAGRMDNSGQACNGSKRILVIDSIYDEFTRKFTAAISRQRFGTDYGPLASAEAAQTLEQQVTGAIDQGAELLTGNPSANGAVFTPGVLVGVTPEMNAYHEELFGPVAQLYRVADDIEAIEVANATPYGLGAVVICDDRTRAERVGEQLDVGMVFIGAAGLEAGDVPFGGVKRSGYGRELGRFGMEEFSNRKLFRYAE